MKILKIFHLLFIMIWSVGVIAMTLLCLLSVYSDDELYMKLKIIRFIDDTLVIPGAILTIITAIIYGLFTNWGFFKYRWITVKWIASVFIILIGTFIFSPILDHSLKIAKIGKDSAIYNTQIAHNTQISFWGGIFQGTALIIIIIISVFKPWKSKNRNR